MLEAGIVEKTDLVKILKKAREQVLKEWDISFGINGEVLTNIMSFISDINTDVLMKFCTDKILVQLKSPDNIQYSEIEISAVDILDYNPSIIGEPNRKDAKSIMKDINGEEFKCILVDIKGTADEISPFAQKDDLITIRVDSYFYKRIEFHCPGNVIVWSQLLDPSTALKAVEKLPGIIKVVRENPNIKKASAIIEPATFQRICAIGGKGGGKKRDIDDRIFIQLNKEDGLYITSGDKLKGRIFSLKPMGSGTDNVPGMTGVPGDISGNEMVEDMMDKMMDDGGYDEAEYGESYAPGREGKKKAVRPDRLSKAPMDMLLGMEADEIPQYIYLAKEYILPFTKLRGLAPIIIEIRTDKPVFFEQKPFGGIRVFLTIAPRIESEDDK